MGEFSPAAPAPARPTAEQAGGEVPAARRLPRRGPARRRPAGRLLVALQAAGGSGDASRDVAAALLLAKDAEPGDPIANLGHLEPGPRLQDILDLDVPFEVTVEQDFAFWLADDEERTPDIEQAIQQSSEGIVPTAPIEGVTRS